MPIIRAELFNTFVRTPERVPEFYKGVPLLSDVPDTTARTETDNEVVC